MDCANERIKSVPAKLPPLTRTLTRFPLARKGSLPRLFYHVSRDLATSDPAPPLRFVTVGVTHERRAILKAYNEGKFLCYSVTVKSPYIYIIRLQGTKKRFVVHPLKCPIYKKLKGTVTTETSVTILCLQGL